MFKENDLLYSSSMIDFVIVTEKPEMLCFTNKQEIVSYMITEKNIMPMVIIQDK